MKKQPSEERFWAKVDPCRTDGCFVWMGAKTTDGYGSFGAAGRTTIRAHHFLKGKPPKGLESDHLCRNRACVNSEHIEHVSPWINKMRSASPPAKHAAATHCAHGHPYDLLNTIFDKRGYRYCRECRLTHNASLQIIRDAAFWREYRAQRAAQGRPIIRWPKPDPCCANFAVELMLEDGR